MSYDGNESRDIKQGPLAPKSDNSWIETLPEYQHPQFQPAEPQPATAPEPDTPPPDTIYLGRWRSGTICEWIPSLRRARPEDIEYTRHCDDLYRELVKIAIEGLERLALADPCECEHDTENCCAKVEEPCAICTLAALAAPVKTAPLFYCNKCGWFGNTSEHEGCNYAAAPHVAPVKTYEQGLREAAEIAESLKNGYTVDILTGALLADEDGPWHLGSTVGEAIRARLRTEARRERRNEATENGPRGLSY